MDQRHQQACGSKVAFITAVCVLKTVLVTVEVDRVVLSTVIVDVTVAATVPENTVAGGGVTVLVWTISTVFVSVRVDAGASVVCTTGAAVCTTVVVSGPSGPSRLTSWPRRASLAERAALRRRCGCLGGLVGLAVGAWVELLGWDLVELLG
jgi:hypothetical protein